MTIPKSMVEDLPNMGTGELYSLIEVLKEEGILNNKEINKIKEVEDGIKMKIPLLYIIEKWYHPYPMDGKINIGSFGKFCIIEFYKEKRHRDSIMRKIILDHVTQKNPLVAR